MRSIVLMMLLVPMMAIAQNQQGYVKTKGRLGNNGTVIAGQRLAGTTVQVKGRTAVVSQKNGTFSFPIPSQNYYLQSVQKQGYVLTDPDVLSKQYAYSKNPLVLVLETPSQQMDDKLAAERKIRRTLQRQLQDKEDEIESLKEQQKLSEEEYRKKLIELYNQQEADEKLISEMAEKYSQIDYDQLDEFNRQVSMYILNGELQKADSLLNTKGDIISDVSAFHNLQDMNAKERIELARRQDNLDKKVAYEKWQLEDLAKRCYSKYEIFSIQHQHDSAAYYIELRANLDTLNVRWQLDASQSAIDNLADMNLALHYTTRALNNSIALYGDDCLMTAVCYENLALFQSSVEEIIKYYKKAFDIALKIEGEKCSLIAAIYNNLGDLYRTIGIYNQAIEYLQKSLNIYNELYGDKNMWSCIVLGNMGLIYNRLNMNEMAIDVYNKALNIYQSIEETDRKPSFLANIYEKLGGAYNGDNNELALEYFEKSLDIRMHLYPDYHPMIGESYHHLGVVNYNLGKIDLALNFYKKSLDRECQIALNYNNIAIIYDDKGDYVRALEYYNKALQYVLSTLGDKHIDTALIYNNIAHILLKQEKYSEALDYFEKSRAIYIDTPGNFSNIITGLGRYMYMCYHKLLIVNKEKYINQYKNYLQDIVFTATVMSSDCAAAQLGMEGKYYLFEFEDWTSDSLFDIANQIEKYKSKEKTILVMKDNKIEKIHFNNGLMGLGIIEEYVGKEEKVRIMEVYNKWRNNQ